jgi:hypothetical protein
MVQRSSLVSAQPYTRDRWRYWKWQEACISLLAASVHDSTAGTGKSAISYRSVTITLALVC